MTASYSESGNGGDLCPVYLFFQSTIFYACAFSIRELYHIFAISRRACQNAHLFQLSPRSFGSGDFIAGKLLISSFLNHGLCCTRIYLQLVCADSRQRAMWR